MRAEGRAEGTADKTKQGREMSVKGGGMVIKRRERREVSAEKGYNGIKRRGEG